MQSPPAEWAVLIGSLGLLDYLRSRGEADADTLSEVIRDLTRRHPHGDLLLGATLATTSAWLWRHITHG